MAHSPSQVDDPIGTVSFQEELQPARAQYGVRGEFRTCDPKWLLVEEGFTLPREHEIELGDFTARSARRPGNAETLEVGGASRD